MKKATRKAFAEYWATDPLKKVVIASKSVRLSPNERYAVISYVESQDIFAAGWKACEEAMKK